MTQEKKQLLIKDLCGRLPYGVICRCRTTEDSTWWNTDHCIFGITGDNFDVGSDILEPEQIKPYLRPMSSMTEEEKREFHHVASLQRNYVGDGVFYTHWQMNDWLNKKMFDYRGLIPMGLALEASEGMYNV